MRRLSIPRLALWVGRFFEVADEQIANNSTWSCDDLEVVARMFYGSFKIAHRSNP